MFGHSFLNFFRLKGLEKYKNDTTFVHMRSSDHLQNQNMWKNGTSLR